MLITIILSVVIAFLLGKLKYKELKEYVRKFKEKVLNKESRKGAGGEPEGTGEDAGDGDKDRTVGGNDCKGQG